jgi:hypothetical protein
MKTIIFLLLLAVVWSGRNRAFTQDWELTGAASNHWQSIASSADGTQLVAGCSDGSIYISTNSGTTWIQNTNAPDELWSSIASSADGTKLVAAAYSAGIYTSTNSGMTWNTNNLPGGSDWESVASSTDGAKLAVAASFPPGSGAVYTSTNSGATWLSNNVQGVCLACSADGSKLYLAGSSYVFASTNFGSTWAQLPNSPFLGGATSLSQEIASSADGNKLALAVFGFGQIYTSTNAETTWNLATIPNFDWSFIASSADGKTLVATPGGAFGLGPICVSTNEGLTWNTNTSPYMLWGAVAASADGGELLAAGNTGTDFISDEPIYLSQSVRSPLMGFTPANGNIAVSWLAPSTNFVLQQSPDLQNWSDVTNQPCLNFTNLNDEVDLPMTNSLGFFRLATQ